MIEFEIRLRQHRLEDVEARENLLPVLLAVRAAVAGVLDLFTHDDDAACSAASLQANGGCPAPPAGDHHLRAEPGAPHVDVDSGVPGEFPERRGTVGAKRTDQPVVGEGPQRHQRHHGGQPDEGAAARVAGPDRR